MVPILCYPQTKSCQNIVVFIYFNSHLPYANDAIFTADRFPGSVPFAVRFGSCWYYGSDLLRFMSVRFVRFDSVHGDTEIMMKYTSECKKLGGIFHQNPCDDVRYGAYTVLLKLGPQIAMGWFEGHHNLSCLNSKNMGDSVNGATP